MSKIYDYTAETIIEITNVINPNSCAYTACDPGNRGIKVPVEYKTVEDKPGITWEYLFDPSGAFLTNGKEGEEKDYVVLATFKHKNTERFVPAYRAFNKKISLAATTEPNEDGKYVGDSVKFKTTNKDEVVFYEKVAQAFLGELEVKFNDKIYGVDYGEN